jgi:parvulin-like peptidyl-prolyl isomerase
VDDYGVLPPSPAISNCPHLPANFGKFCRFHSQTAAALSLCVPAWIDLMRQLSLYLLTVIVLTGCAGRSIEEDNPILGPAPPRSALTADEDYYRDSKSLFDRSGHRFGEDDRVVLPASYSTGTRLDYDLTGNQVVATVNGQPLFSDEVLGGYAARLEQIRSEAPREEFAKIQRMLLKRGLQQPLQFQANGQPILNIVDQAIVLQAAETVLAQEQKDMIEEQLDSAFEKYAEHLRDKMNLATLTELDEKLASEGSSLARLREETGKQQLALSFIQEKTKKVNKVERPELLQYYEDHLQDYTYPRKVKWQQIVVRFGSDKEGGKSRMRRVWLSLKDGIEFAEVAREFSDGATAQDGGQWDWIERDSLADKDVEDILFELPKGGISDLIVRDDRFELVRVSDLTAAGKTSFEDVQRDIEKMLLKKSQQQAVRDFMTELRATVVIESIFDNDSVEEDVKRVSLGS